MSAGHLRTVGIKMLLMATLLLLPSLATGATETTSPNKIIMRAKPAVVRVLDGMEITVQLRDGRKEVLVTGSTGSGFFISPNGYIMTNAHVVRSTKQGDDALTGLAVNQVLAGMLQRENYAPTQENIEKLKATGLVASAEATRRFNVVLLSDGSALSYEIKSYGTPIGEERGQLVGKDVAIIKVELQNAPTLQLADSGSAKEGDAVYVIGFPAAAESAVLDLKSVVEPTTNGGAISAIKSTRDGIPVLQTNAPATHGNSGGPVLNANGEVIGLLTFAGEKVNEQEVGGFSFVVTSNTAKEFIAQAGANNSPGLVDKLWQQGLTDYGKGHLKKAKESFQEVRNLSPHHSEAQRLIAECDERILKGEDKTFAASKWLAIGIAIAALVVVGIGLLLLRRRFAVQPAAAHGGAPGSGAAPGAATVHHAAKLSPSQAIVVHFQTGPLAGKNYEVPTSGLWLGRDASKADIVVPDDEISRQHLWLGVANSQWVLRDNRSTNGTYVNSVQSDRVEEHVLKPDETIILTKDAVATFSVTQ